MDNANYIVSTEYDGKPRKLYKRTCVQCDVDFYTPKHVTRTVCSRLCSSARIKDRNHVTVQCAQCDAPLVRTLGRIDSSRHKKFFCNRICKELGQSLRGNCQEIRPKHFGTALVPNYRHLVDIKKCAGCGCNERYLLVVHHIDGDRENNVIDNLRVLCFNCHGRHHLFERDSAWCYSTSALTPEHQLRDMGLLGVVA